MILLYCKRKLSYPAESGADGEWKVIDLVLGVTVYRTENEK